jgi:predicted nicotinamide N-methyase
METTAIAEKYELKVMPISIQGKALELYGMSNWDHVVENLEEKGEQYIKQFPFWIKIWEASIVLADHLVQLGLDKALEIIELGAGMGITGLFLGAFGHKVTITDYEDDALELLQMNVEKNNLVDRVKVRKLDWNRPDLTHKYDVICGSELIYKDSTIEPVIKLFKETLKPAGTIFLAHDIRRMCMMKFIGTVPGRYEIENVVKSMKGDGDVFRIVIHTLKVKE